MKPLRSNYALFAIAQIALTPILAGCVDQTPVAPDVGNQESKTSDPEDAMFALVSEEAVYHVLRNVDRPFDAKFEKPVIHILPDDPTIANVAVYCTFTENNRTVKRLFFIMFENTRSPEFATNKEDLACLLINADGKVLDRDDDYWSGLPQGAQQQSGAIDGDGPPFIPTTMLKFKDL